ncbi:hypothetical protein ACFPT7_19005 [Acidicapsa dinghuensis]|uniref:Uncharacterized protein n=1 Tax=Acidicapsa dinghuensis TaxID=2218256 RepID=A0ABW1EN73_9BACT|nr:hypothetical protein [Acidicapsa dinghuensis]
MNPVVLHVEPNNHETDGRIERVANQVRDYFTLNFAMPTNARVICYLDGTDRDWLKQMWGGASNRGVHWPIRGQGLHDWPQDMWCTIACSDPPSGEIDWPYESVIYLHGSTCQIEVQLAMTLAHELQHFLQYSHQRQTWAINTLLAKLPYLPSADLNHWYDLPAEREARIIGKRVSEAIFGKLVVNNHIEIMARTSCSVEDAADWSFIRALDSNEAYDVRAATIPFVERHRQGLEDLQRTTFSADKDLGTVSLDI